MVSFPFFELIPLLAFHISTDDESVAISFDGSRIYTLSNLVVDDHLSKLNSATAKVSNQIPLSYLPR